jgi:hypothetical protein
MEPGQTDGVDYDNSRSRVKRGRAEAQIRHNEVTIYDLRFLIALRDWTIDRLIRRLKIDQ